ncbi:MAG: hypothetical protein Q4G46_10280 [Propionibacteriaceae bacterium]|nr:hypothetical protein [Propionibacteriaceae bacterium]
MILQCKPRLFLDWLGREADRIEEPRAEIVLRTASMAVHAYTRGRGYDETGEPNEELTAVIFSVAARMLNPQGVASKSVSIDDGNVATTYSTQGFTLLEQAVLHRYRQRAQ